MANLIHFHELPPSFVNPYGPTRPGASGTERKLSAFGQSGRDFSAQFEEVAALDMFTARADLQLRACALDAGHGWHLLNTMATPPADQLALHRHKLRQLESLLSALPDRGTPPDISLQRAGLIALLDKSEKNTLSYQLGAISCRLATGAWVSKRCKQVLRRFWHFSLATDAAVCLIKDATVHLPAVLNPDYIFETEGGWYTAEAKGSWNGQDWAELEEGLQQAAKFECLRFFNPAQVAIPTLQVVQAYTCTRADFFKSELRITHVDPPTRVDPKPARVLMCVAEFGDLVRFEQAFAQFESAGDALMQEPGPRPDGGGQTPIHWRVWQRGERPSLCIYLGMTERMATLRLPLELALGTLRRLMPLCCIDPGEELQAGLDRPVEILALTTALDAWWHRWRNIDARADADAWLQSLLGALTALQADRSPRATIIRLVAQHRGLPGGLNIIELANLLGTQARTSAAAIDTDAKLGQVRDAQDRLQLCATDHGLLVASGSWHQAPPRADRRKVKI